MLPAGGFYIREQGGFLCYFISRHSRKKVGGCIKIQTHPLFIYIEKHKKSPDFPKPGLCHITKNLYLCDI